jgi:hypothetical protein
MAKDLCRERVKGTSGLDRLLPLTFVFRFG